jgi:PTH1 family peptidyl-tRNA hydrolase
MKLIVGLGNPGRKYQGTRHNVGYEVLRRLAEKTGVGSPRTQFQGETVSAEVAEEKLLLLCPQTFMNLSGSSVQPARDFYKLENDDLLIVCDDFNLPLGKIRLRGAGSAGGQKGLDDIIRRLGTDEVPRLRVGIGPVPEGWDPAGFVLGKFARDDAPEIAQTCDVAAEAVEAWVRNGIEYAMNQYN